MRDSVSASIILVRVTATATGTLAGIGAGVLVADGRVWPLVAVPLLGLGLWGAVRLLVPPEDRRVVGAVLALALALQVAAAVVLYTGALALGRGGFIPGDDRAYFELADNFVRYLRGDAQPPGTRRTGAARHTSLEHGSTSRAPSSSSPGPRCSFRSF